MLCSRRVAEVSHPLFAKRFENSPSKETKVAKTPRFCNGVFSEAGGGGLSHFSCPL